MHETLNMEHNHMVPMYFQFQTSFGLSISTSATIAMSDAEADCKTDFLVVTFFFN